MTDPKSIRLPILEVEEWRPIPGIDGHAASNHGRIRISGPPPGPSLCDPDRGRLLRPYVLWSGHLQVWVKAQSGRGKFYVHRLVLLAFVGPCPEGLETRHLDGNPANNRLDNLAYGTCLENAKDKFRHKVIRGELAAVALPAIFAEMDARDARKRAKRLEARRPEDISPQAIPHIIDAIRRGEDVRAIARRFGAKADVILKAIDEHTRAVGA